MMSFVRNIGSGIRPQPANSGLFIVKYWTLPDVIKCLAIEESEQNVFDIFETL